MRNLSEGLKPGATVPYAGGPKVGRVDSVQLDPQNPGRLNVVFSVQSDLPVKVDRNVKIMSMSPLGDKPTTRPESSASYAMGCVGYNFARGQGHCVAGRSWHRQAIVRSNHGSR